MKKIVIALFAAMLCITASAQLRTSRTFFKTEGRGTEWIIRAGLSINNAAGFNIEERIKDYFKPASSLGFDFDFGFNKYFGQSNLYWGMELGVGTRGFANSEADEDKNATAYNVKYSPFTIGYKYPLTETIKIDAHFGGFATYDFAHSSGFSTDNDYDFGIQVGAGVWYGRVNLDFMYQRGFVDAYWVTWAGTATTSNFLIRIGYAF